MSYHTSFYLGPVIFLKKRIKKIEYINLVCPNSQCKIDKYPSGLEKIVAKFCANCGYELQEKYIYRDYTPDLYEILQENKFIECENLSEISINENYSLSETGMDVVLICNKERSYCIHFDGEHFPFTELLSDKERIYAIENFKRDHNAEIKVIMESYDNVKIKYGIISRTT